MKNLRRYRREKGYTQAELAKALGVDQSAVCRWERGELKPAPSKLCKLIELLGHNEAELNG